MPHYRRHRQSRDPLRGLIIDLVSVPLMVICVLAFTWLFSRPGMWNFSLPVRTTPTAAPIVAASADTPGNDFIVNLFLLGILIGGGALLTVVVALFVKQLRAARPSSKSVSVYYTQPVEAAPAPEKQSNQLNDPNIPDRPRVAVVTPEPADRNLAGDEPQVEAGRVLSKFERAFFWALRHALGDDYYIFPQIPLRGLVSEAQRFMIGADLNWMMNKGVLDFVLADPETLEAKLACEFDDPSHEQADVRARDRRKDELLDIIGLPLVRFPSTETWEVNSLRRTMQDAMATDCGVTFLAEYERGFFKILREADGGLFVFPKIPLKSLVYRKGRLPLEAYKALQDETVDFCVAHPKYLGTKAVVELHAADDSEKSLLLAQAHIPVLYYEHGQMPTPADLRAQLAAALRGQEISATDRDDAS